MADPDPSMPVRSVDCEFTDNIRIPVRAVMEAENWILSRMPPDQKLVILIGEQHDCQNHVLFSHALLQEHSAQFRTQRERTFAFGAEIEHNYLAKHRGADIADPKGQIGMRAFNRSTSGWRSLQARQGLFDYCIRRNISVGFNDIADVQVGNGLYLDERDPATRSIMERHRPDLLGKYTERSIGGTRDGTGASGFDLSNIAMVENGMAHMERAGAKIYIQTFGMFHMMGTTEKGYSYENSVSAQFRKQGHEVLCVVLANESFTRGLPAEARAEYDNAIKVSNMNYLGDRKIPYRDAAHIVGRASGYTF